ncbi:MAG: PEGA domain-containing protein [Polyangiaceae bacterium]
MHEIRIKRRWFARFLSFALMFTLAGGLVASSARAQTPSPAPDQAPSAPATPPAATPPAPAPPPAAPAPAPVATPPAPPPQATKEQLAEAKKFYDNGKKLAKEGLYQEALASFLEANRISPRASIQQELANTYRLLKDMPNAYEAHEVLLTKYGDQLKPNVRLNAQHALEELEVLTGVVVIAIQEPGAHVLIDQKDVGVTPIAKPIRLSIATHQLTITKDGFDTINQAIDIQGHSSIPVNGPLVKTVTTGHVTVDVKQTEPPDPTVLVYVDTADAGPPPYAGDLDPGLHTFEAKGDKDVGLPKQIQVEKKGTYSEVIDLHVKAGTIVVSVDVADSEISLDGNVIGHGAYEGSVPAGTHALTVTKFGYGQYKKDLIVDDGQRVIENVPLQKEWIPPPVKQHDWTGAYSQLNFIGQFEVTNPTNDIAQGVGYPKGTPISTDAVGGGDLGVRVGYSFGFIGIEGAFLLGFDHSNTTATPTSSTPNHQGPGGGWTESYDFNRAGGTAGVGVRLMPKTPVFRPTLGVAGGVSLKEIWYNRNSQYSNGSATASLSGGPQFYAAPSIMIDAGIELGSTPGTRFYLGCQMVADFASASAISPNTTNYSGNTYPIPNALVPGQPGINGVNGTDIFIGPILGMQFGE